MIKSEDLITIIFLICSLSFTILALIATVIQLNFCASTFSSVAIVFAILVTAKINQ